MRFLEDDSTGNLWITTTIAVDLMGMNGIRWEFATQLDEKKEPVLQCLWMFQPEEKRDEDTAISRERERELDRSTN